MIYLGNTACSAYEADRGLSTMWRPKTLRSHFCAQRPDPSVAKLWGWVFKYGVGLGFSNVGFRV